MSEVLTLIPILIFGGAFVAVFFVFMAGSAIYLFSGNSEKGKKMIMSSLFLLALVLIMFLAFSSITYLIKKGDIFNSQAEGEFPNSLSSEFPPALNNR